MSIRQRRLNSPPRDWVLVANAARARCFERDAEHNALRELADFVHPQSRMKAGALSDERGGKVYKSAASTRFEPRTSVHDKEHEHFARELARYLDDAVLAHRCPGLAVLASDPFLGEIKSHLGEASQRLLKASIALDLTAYSGAELERRVAQALHMATE